VAPVAHVEEWTDDCASIAEIEHALVELRFRHSHGGEPDLRTSVLTHIAWVPEEWQQAATATLAGLAERHPSRTLLLFPQPEACGWLAARVALECHELPGLERHLCNEVIELRLQGSRSRAPASIAMPLLLPDLPVFLRWRGRPPFATGEFRQLIELTDRLIIDSAEWPDVPGAYEELDNFFETAAISDIAWRRTKRWRETLARSWPDLPDRIAAPSAEAALVAGWLRWRVGIEVTVEEADEVPHAENLDASDLLSEELDVFGRDPVYEAATRSAGGP
jgi:hypothetical protein